MTLPDDDDPNDPSHPDHDLSERGETYPGEDAPFKPWFLRRWLLLVAGLVVVAALLLPLIRAVA